VIAAGLIPEPNDIPVPTSVLSRSDDLARPGHPGGRGSIGQEPSRGRPTQVGGAAWVGPAPASAWTQPAARRFDARWPGTSGFEQVEPGPRGLLHRPLDTPSADPPLARSEKVGDPWPELPEERSTNWFEPWRAAWIEAERRKKLDLEQMGMPWNV
jgi:hypothetical protein